MPSVHLRPDRRTFYLDTSTLSYASGIGVAARVSPRFADLRTCVEGIAKTSNLVLSSMHVIELAQGDEVESHERLAWIDGLDAVWTYNFHHVREDEDERALRRAVGIVELPDVELYAPSLMSVFKQWGVAETSEALQDKSPLQALGAAAREKRIEKEHATIREMQSRFYFDRNLDPAVQRMTPTERAASNATKRRDMLRGDAAAAWDRLRWADERAFHDAYRAHGSPGEAFVDLVLKDPTSMPSYFVADEFGQRFVEVMARRKPGGKKAGALESSFFDYAHLAVGAAYCDVFTCDALTSECLGDARAELRRDPQIVFAGDADAFVRALEDAATK